MRGEARERKAGRQREQPSGMWERQGSVKRPSVKVSSDKGETERLEPSLPLRGVSVRVIKPKRTHAVKLIGRELFSLKARPDPNPTVVLTVRLRVHGRSGLGATGVAMVRVKLVSTRATGVAER